MQLVPPRGVIRNDLPEDSRRFFELGRGICTSADGRTLMVEVKTGRLLVPSCPFPTPFDLWCETMVHVVSMVVTEVA